MNSRSWIVVGVITLWSSCTYDHFNEISSKCAGTTISLAIAVVNATTCVANDGSLTISARGGVKNYNFSVNNGAYQTDSVYTNLKSGSYTVVVKDANGCTATKIASVNNAQSSLQISTTTTANSGCPTANGTVTVTATGAISPVQYKLNKGSYQSSNIFNGLAAGNYSVTVLDATGCPVSGAATVASNGPSFKTDVSSIISGNCATVGCHDGNRSPNLSSYSGISSNGASVVSAINGNMPPNGKLTAQQIALITCWVSDGALNN